VEQIRAAFSMSERHACGLLGIAVSSCRYRSCAQERERELRSRLVELAHENPRYGSPRLYVLLRRETRCNHKRVERIYREAGLSLRRKKRKRLVRQRVPMTMPLAANEEWALDFVADALASARSLRILTVVDAFTRECLALETDTSMGSLRVVRVLERLIAERGVPQRIRTDNGPEFTSRAYLAWSLERRIELIHIRPGKPIENALVESFNGRLREECLNTSWFRNLFDARRQIEAWRDHYNRVRPHSALDYRTPVEFAALRAAGQFRAGVREGASNAGPFPHTPIPAKTGEPTTESCRMLE
jgi:putative transposase